MDKSIFDSAPVYSCINGIEKWSCGYKLHRVDGPAIIFPDGEQRWVVNGIWHRTDGPAAIQQNGDVSWYLDGYNYSFNQWLLVNTVISAEQKVMLKLQYG